MSAERPEAYIQDIRDEFEENTDEFDRMNKIIGGDVEVTDRGYRAAILLDDEYRKEEFPTPEEAYDWITDVNQEEGLDHELDSVDDLVVEERHWLN